MFSQIENRQFNQRTRIGLTKDDEPPDQVFSTVSSLKRPISEDDQVC